VTWSTNDTDRTATNLQKIPTATYIHLKSSQLPSQHKLIGLSISGRRLAIMDRFKNLTFSQPQITTQTGAMTTYLSNMLTTATSKANNLRRTLIASEADGDTEDDSHIARVLRAYYTEKGRSFPQWLPPDPKTPNPPPAQMVSSSGATQAQPYGQPAQAGSRWGRGGGLSDLWDGPKAQQQQEDTNSLRPRPGMARANVAHSLSEPTASGGRRGRFGNSLEEPAQARPLPSQRAGSYQTQFSQSATSMRPLASDTSPPPSAGSGSTAQERLKQRLWGGARAGSPTPGSSNLGTTAPNSSPVNNRNPYDIPDGRSGSSSASRLNDDRGYGDNGISRFGDGSSANNNTSVSANSPWSGSDDPYAPSGGAYSGGGGYGGGPYASGNSGLPSGPRGPRQGGVGLPMGPRPKR